MNFNGHRPQSDSNTTLVEKNMEPNSNIGSKSEDTLGGTTYYSSRTQKKLWVDRLFGLFCAKPSIHNENEKTKSSEVLEVR
jgi:hypothetical protein